MNGIFGSFYGSACLTTTEVDHTPASVLALPTCRSAGSHGKTGIESLMAIESSPPRYWQGCITNIAWNLWRREPLEGIRRRTSLLRITAAMSAGLKFPRYNAFENRSLKREPHLDLHGACRLIRGGH